jgi:hypothetical protein
MQLRYPRCIHAEFMTHRAFSRNASSSRAIPVERLIQDVLDDPYVPLHWGKNQPGMQAREEHDALISPFPLTLGSGWNFRMDREEAWLHARDLAVAAARAFTEAGYHKQIVNRLLEPFAHINVVVTATDWANFFGLRDHPDAEPHIAILAREMKLVMGASTPLKLKVGEWHLPYVDHNDFDALTAHITKNTPNRESEFKRVLQSAIKLSVARCARVSYLTQDGKTPTIEADLALYDRLVGGNPLHASPTEHQATPGDKDVRSGNFRGWVQFRKTLEGECLRD